MPRARLTRGSPLGILARNPRLRTAILDMHPLESIRHRMALREGTDVPGTIQRISVDASLTAENLWMLGCSAVLASVKVARSMWCVSSTCGCVTMARMFSEEISSSR